MQIDLNQTSTPQVVVVAQGVLKRDSETLRLLGEAPHIIVCDGALARYLKLTDRHPDVVIGDGDSVSKADLKRAGVPLTKVDDQETNDLTKGVTYALKQGWREIVIIGAAGRREDHTVGNIFLLPEYFKMGAVVRLHSPYGSMLPFQGHLKVQTEVGRGLSLFATEPKPMSASGVAYPFERRTFTALWQATLNLVTSPEVELFSEGIALLFISHEKRDK